VLAWALDGLVPRKLADVSDRTHSPLWSIGLSGVLGIVFLFVYAFDPSFATISGFFGQVFTFLLTSIAAIVFPFTQRDMFAASPIKWRIGKVPVLSILGMISVIGLCLIEWAFLNDPNSGISFQSPLMLDINVGVLCLDSSTMRWRSGYEAHRESISDLSFGKFPRVKISVCSVS